MMVIMIMMMMLLLVIVMMMVRVTAAHGGRSGVYVYRFGRPQPGRTDGQKGERAAGRGRTDGRAAQRPDGERTAGRAGGQAEGVFWMTAQRFSSILNDSTTSFIDF